MLKRFCCIFLCLFFPLCACTVPCCAVQTPTDTAFPDIDARSAILMEAETGTVLYENNADEALPPASVTKIMTMLLVFEALDDGRIAIGDTVRVSDYAASMGGSQVYLKAGEEMTVDELLKSVIVASANDAAVALAEHVCGSEQAFVAQMNERAAQLGMNRTVFKNTNGLDDSDTGHVTSARDIALMTREVLTHKAVFSYSTIWTDSIRGGAFGLTNTNRLVRFYRGCTGLKTGSTAKAGFCISATAERDGMHLICVVMGAPTKDARNALAASLLDYGFSGWCTVSCPAAASDPIPVRGGTDDTLTAQSPALTVLLRRADKNSITSEVHCPAFLRAPIAAGDVIGKITCRVGETVLAEADITAPKDIPRIGFLTLMSRMLAAFAFSVVDSTEAPPMN